MRMSFNMLIIIILTTINACSIEKPKADKQHLEVNPTISFCQNIASPMAILVESNTHLDKELFINTFRFQAEHQTGFETFLEYCAKLKPADLSPEICAEFSSLILNGAWRDAAEKILTQGLVTSSYIRTIIFLQKSIRHDYPELSKKLSDFVINHLELISEPQQRAINLLFFSSELHLSGLTDMKGRIKADSELLLRAIKNNGKKVNDEQLLIALANIASVDADSAFKLKEQIFSEHILQVEALASIAAGLMLSDYETGRKYFLKAIEEFNPKELDEKYISHRAFDLGFTRLKLIHQKEVFDKYMKVLLSFDRLPLIPPTDPTSKYVFEPLLPSWYREEMYNFMIENFQPADRVRRLNKEIMHHAQRYPRSKNTEQFIGWSFDWLKQVDDKKERYLLLGELCLIPNVIYPDRVSKAIPQINLLAKDFNKLAPKLELKELLFDAIFNEKPSELRKKLISYEKLNTDYDLMTTLFALIRVRHYFYPKNDGGLCGIMQDALENWEGDSRLSKSERDTMIIEMWAGWNDNKAWEHFEKMDYKEGEFPMLMVNIINSTRGYAPGFARRCLDFLISKYDENAFKQTNPQMEMELVFELARGSVAWAEELASEIIEKRGNEHPVFSFYALHRRILMSALLSGAEQKDIERLSSKIQNELRKDLEKYSKTNCNNID